MGEEERVRLRDGSAVIVRAVRPEDRELFAAGFERMSDESRYRRFMSHKKKLSDRELEFFTRLDHELHEAIGALGADSGDGAGVARMHRRPEDPSIAEAAVTVVDDWQGRGLGGVLLDRLTARARELGVRHFEATLFTTNKAMLRLFEKLGCMRSHREDLDVLAIDVELPLGAAADDEALSTALRSVAEGSSAVEPATV
jgi:RimJ/RimL family protein N-acetyltransferase